jgi:hypothetical protein
MNDLNVDILFHIFEFLDIDTLIKITRVCKFWKSILINFFDRKPFKSQIICQMQLLKCERNIIWSQNYTLESDGITMAHEYCIHMKMFHEQKKIRRVKQSFTEFFTLLKLLNDVLKINKQ